MKPACLPAPVGRRHSIWLSLPLLSGALSCISPIGLFAQQLSFKGPASTVDFGDVNLCGPGSTVTGPCQERRAFSFEVTGSGTVGKIGVVTRGASGLDFTLLSGSTCLGAVASGTACTVNVKFEPKFAGTRPGAILIEDENGRTLTTTLIRGNGVGSQIGFGPGFGSQLGSDFSFNLEALALDDAGNKFFADATNARVLELRPDGTQITLPFSGLSFPAAIAVDGAGDIFVADAGNNQVIELSADHKTETTLPFSGLSSPQSLMVDATGNIFAVGYYNDAVLELPADARAQVEVGGNHNPGAVAVDGAGNLFLTASGANSENSYGEVLEMPTGVTELKTIGTGEYWNRDVLTVDGPGNIYTVDYNSGEIIEILSGGGAPVQVAGGYTYPGELDVTPSGDIFMVDQDDLTGASQLYELQRSKSAPLDFGSIPVGATATLPLPITNIGNRRLVLTPLFKSPSYMIKSMAPEGCMEGTPVGQTCTLQVEFSALTEGEHRIALTLRSNGAEDATVQLQGVATKP